MTNHKNPTETQILSFHWFSEILYSIPYRKRAFHPNVNLSEKSYIYYGLHHGRRLFSWWNKMKSFAVRQEDVKREDRDHDKLQEEHRFAKVKK